MAEYDHLPPRERAKKYRQLAEDARVEAERATDRKVKEAYAIIAARWQDMARDIENRLARGNRWELD